MADQVRVFVSHHHSPEEDAFTEQLVADLQAAGADVWVDTAGITSDDFVKKINEGLSGRHWLVLIMTPAALTSPWVQREVNVALNEHTAGRMRGILPIVMQPCRDQEIPIMWRTLHRYDTTNGYDQALQGLLVGMELKEQVTSARPPQTPSALPAYMPPTSESSPPRTHTPPAQVEPKTGFWERLFGQGHEPRPGSKQLVIGHLVVIDAGSSALPPGSRLDIQVINTIGRAPTNTIVVESTYISVEHTRISYRNRSLWVEDLGSRNGTLVNNASVTAPIAAKPGDVLQVGDVRFKFAV
jgi:TIR domain-containing protein/FHA domain-containing protein